MPFTRTARFRDIGWSLFVLWFLSRSCFIPRKMNRKIWQEIRKLFQGTGYAGFYDDPESNVIVIQVLQNIVDKGNSAQDKNMPAFWFSSQVYKGIDYVVLFRFFRQGL